MNYLAHLFLSFKDPDLMMGNFIADDIRLSHIKSLSRPVQLGIGLHRKIDEYTDNHDSFIKATDHLRTNHGKYASVIIDIINDHLLCQSWETFSDERITKFHDFVYYSMEQNNEELQGSAKKHVEALLSHKYLHVYQTKEGLENVMQRMDKRTRFPSDFHSSVKQMYNDYNMYFDLFNDLFVDLTTNLDKLLEDAKEDLRISLQSEKKK